MSVKRAAASSRLGRWSSYGKIVQPGGRVDAVARLERPLEPAGHVAEALPVQPRRGRGGAREPVERQRVQDPVLADRRARVGPGVELLADPGRETGGRVGQRVADRLRAGAVLGGVAGVVVRLPPRGGGGRQRRHEVDAGDVLAILLPEARAHAGAPVRALGAVAGVTEPRHQRRPRAGDPRNAPARLGRLAAPAVARQGGDDAVEARLGEQREDVEELDDAARPAVREDEREGVGARRARVQEVDAQAVDRGGELRRGVEAPLRRAPVVVLHPALAAFLEPLERDALARIGRRLGPAGRAQPRAEILQLGLRDGQVERLDHRGTNAVRVRAGARRSRGGAV